ncbi:metal-dependent hydrolase [Crocosphaera sp. XPORK-15E]|uniref:metal-dependent hydrolase n=1 Tax=Crocosphaera sp. XPORK-15E TaxID=3110247 RepID=UPI002B1FC077|nr:metal-dependent hydrolase [Crocosphaera sp. XPORK-15E]MEA5533328.1 metal-dependent hydrolase [Crocosphaera sp. XPORK-15E]
MSSPIGHSLAGIGGFFLIRHSPDFSKYFSTKILLTTGIIFANLPDIDFIFGYIFFQNIGALHRQFTHSFFLGIIISLIVGYCLKVEKRTRYLLILWLMGLYFSHILLDMLAYDRYPPAGVQCWFPFNFSYFAFPMTILGGLNATNGIWHFSNVLTILQEIIVIPLLFFIALSFGQLVKNTLNFYGKNKS